MKYTELYKNCKDAVRKEIQATWCGVPKTKDQAAYKAKIQALMDDIFAPANAMPIVESMADYKHTSLKPTVYEPFVTPTNGLASRWGRKYEPYEHQVECWENLSKGNSIVVTTGTGSGKTECFMLPIAKDIIDNLPISAGKVQAIFLYPLNALMEDQKLRLLQVLEGSDARFAIYNGSCPEDDAELRDIIKKVINDHPRENEEEIAKISAKRILGCSSDKKLNSLKCWADFVLCAQNLQHTKTDKEFPQEVVQALDAFTNIVFTRKAIREAGNHPEILLTNSSMIEYSLLRTSDSSLYTDSAKALKWFAIDETHTYSGAGAIELAMQIKRVLNAFDIDNSSLVRFATSSATVGGTATTTALEDFIKNLTGNKPVVITGTRNPLPGLSIPAINLLSNCKTGYLPLDQMVQEGCSIEDKLGILDNAVDTFNSNNNDKIKIKVHFFFRVLNRGLKVCLSDIDQKNDCFNIHLDIPAHRPTVNAEPYLELARCTSCGEYIAVGQYTGTVGSSFKFRSKQSYTDNLFSLDSTGNDESFETGVFAYMSSSNPLHAGSAFIDVNGDEFKTYRPTSAAAYALAVNMQCNCPHCGKSLQTNSAIEEIGEVDRMKTFRLSAAKVNQMISPSVLDQMKPTGVPADPHQGQQYLTFVDSRKDAAKATLEQNLKIKQEYVYQLVYNKLLDKRLTSAPQISAKLGDRTRLQAEIQALAKTGDFAAIAIKSAELQKVELEIQNLTNFAMPFQDVVDLLDRDDNIQLMFEQSIDDNDILQATKDVYASDTEKQDAVNKLKKCFVYGLAYELLAKRHLRGFSPEAMGLFHSTYPKINNNSDPLPAGVVAFNNAVANPANQINAKDWNDLLTIALNQARSNESMFIQYDDPSGIFKVDIHACRRFASGDSSRKSIHIKDDNTATQTAYSHIVYLLADLLPSTGNLSNTVKNNIAIINDVIKDVNSSLVRLSLSEVGKIIHEDSSTHTETWIDETDDNGQIYRLNVNNIAFRLYDEVAFCDVFGLDEPRPTPVLFKGRSPFFYFGDAKKLTPVAKESWGSTYTTSFANEAALHSWAQANRNQIWTTLWDNDGLFASRLDTIYMYDTAKDFFLQAEHTAQIEKSLSRQYQSLFQEHKINILACSTTMEMGVDLGDLELVMMNSVPPAPANYKQRAGRSGRGQDIYKSAAITLCSSDSLGARTLRDPYGMIIGRTIMPPVINFDNNERIIQRHLNAYCFRRVLFDTWIPSHPGQNALNFSLRDFYTHFDYEKTNVGLRSRTEYHKIKIAGSTNRFLPETTNPLGNISNTIYDIFLQAFPNVPIADCDFIFNVFSPAYGVNKPVMKNKVETMFQDTFDQAKEIAISIGATFEDYCAAQGINPNDPNDLNKIDSDTRLNGITRSLAKLLEKRLIEYLATSRFTPNANMPVDVLEFDVNYSSSSWANNGKSNPSYQLREALSQYSPGNKVVLKNAVYTVGGVAIKGLHRDISDLDVLLHSDQGRISTTDQVQLSTGESWQPWQGHSDKQLMILRPYAFLPESDKDQKSNTHSVGIVKSQLVGVNIWTAPTAGALIDSRSSRQSPTSKILYYNDGYGYGFSYCRKCGRTVPEFMPFDHNHHIDVVKIINNKDKVVNGTPLNYHLALNLYGSTCSYSDRQVDNRAQAGKTTILRHAVIGDYLQTDFTEFRFFWQNGDEINEDRFLNAMGILLCQAYSEHSTIERSDLDFSITADKHLCIFDAYSGGAGNSDKLSDPTLIDALLKDALNLVANAQSSTDLFDKFTLRYEDRADFVTAVDWISAYMASNASTAKVAGFFPTSAVTTASKHDIEAHLQSLGTNGRFGLFTDVDFNSWTDYEPASLSSIKHYMVVNNKMADFCLIGDTSYMPVNVKILLTKMGGWNLLKQCSTFPITGIYPLAIVDSTLYFTDDATCANLNDKWAQGVIYKVAFNTPVNSLPLTVTFDPQKDVVFYLNNPSEAKITSNMLYSIVKGQTNFIDRYIRAIPNTEDTITFTYEDQFLKSRLSVITAVQFIKQMIEDIKTAKPNIKNISITFSTEKDHNNSVETYTGDNIWWSLEERMRKNVSEDYLYDLCASLRSLGISASTSYNLLPNGSQEHWRELKVSCPACNIIISPNGGFANEWKFDKYPIAPVTAIGEDDPVDIDDEIPVFRGKNIKYDMQLSGSAI